MEALLQASFLSLFIGTIGANDLDFGPDDVQSRFEFGAVGDTTGMNVTDSPSVGLKDLVIIVRSQHNSYHVKRANLLKQDLTKQAETMGEMSNLVIRMMHENWAPLGAWTILPIINSLSEEYSHKHWIFFCEDLTVVNLSELMKVLKKFDSRKIAMFIRDEGRGTLLTDVPEFCTIEPTETQECATSVERGPPGCGDLSVDQIFFAVKTTKKYHKDRVPIVKQTLGRYTKHLVYYSETEDPSIPTEDIGVPNTETGHCAKLQAIITRSTTDQRAADKPWLVIVDDDTIMSLPRLQKLLACYDPTEVMLLGERYGYGLTSGYGYEYITGGGGMILSRAAIKALLDSGCECWQPDSPDDMWLGNCFRRLGIPLTHNPSFHQAKPNEYVPSLLAHQTPVSFHKHYDLDPMKVYNQYLN